MRKRDRWARVLVHLYPRAWRARYGDELLALIGATQFTPVVAIDLVVGALRERVRAIVSPGPPVDVRREHRRDMVVNLAGPVFVFGFCWLFGQQLRETPLAKSESPFFYLLLLPILAVFVRIEVVEARCRRILRRAKTSFETPSPDALSAPGISRVEYWLWLAANMAAWTYYATQPSPWLSFSKIYALVCFGHLLKRLRSSTKRNLIRRALIKQLSRPPQIHKPAVP